MCFQIPSSVEAQQKFLAFWEGIFLDVLFAMNLETCWGLNHS
jgi:hypothetical protein